MPPGGNGKIGGAMRHCHVEASVAIAFATAKLRAECKRSANGLARFAHGARPAMLTEDGHIEVVQPCQLDRLCELASEEINTNAPLAEPTNNRGEERYVR